MECEINENENINEINGKGPNYLQESHLEKRKNLMFKILNFVTKFRAIHIAVILSLNKFTTAFFFRNIIIHFNKGISHQKIKIRRYLI